MKQILTLFFLALSAFAFSQNNPRISYTINSGWKFHKGDINTAAPEIDDWQNITLSHTWNAADPFDNVTGYYRGACWYTKIIDIPQEWNSKRIFLHFNGVNQEAQVLINNKPAGTHQGGYTAFGFDISSLLTIGAPATITVRVDNNYNKNIPPLNADFNFYGGIYRDVELVITDPVHFDMSNYGSAGVFVETPQVSATKSAVLVRGSVYNETTDKKSVAIYTSILDKSQKEVAKSQLLLTIAPGASSEFRQTDLLIDHPSLWSPQSPYLYSVYTTIKDVQTGTILDKIVNPLGVRYFSVDPDKGFFLNGKSLPLMGVSRHQDFAGLGNALTPGIHRHDFEMIKAMGANFVRLAHYPQDPEVYKLCDELGLLVWTEIPVVNAVTATDEFFANCKQMQTEQIRQSYNHPSVIIYGYMNEVFINMVTNNKLTKEEKDKNITVTVKLAKELNELTKKEAPGRLTAMAFHQHDIYNETGLADIPDIAGWNLYFGWYYNELKDFGAFLDEQHKKYPHRSMIVSEYGADADVRNFTFKPMVWDFSPDYQQVLHQSYLDQCKTRLFIAGMAAWNFADFGAEGRQDAIPFINKKGLVNYDRTPKDVYYLYQAHMITTPVIHIVSDANAQRSGTENKINSGICIQPVKLFTNQRYAELLINGRSLGKKEVHDCEVTFDVPFTNGVNDLKARAGKTEDDAAINCKVIPYLINSSTFTEIAVNAGSHMYFWDKPNNTLWIPEQPYEKGKWGYIGGKVYNRNPGKNQGIPNRINGTINHPLFQSMREGLSDFRFDVADGQYEITLLFTEPNTRALQRSPVYDLSKPVETSNRTTTNPAEREFDIVINGKKVINALNLALDAGPLCAETIILTEQANNGSGLDVKFVPVKGESILSGIKIRSIK
jgi:beta-galactosidase